MRLALFQPDIPQNLGAALRLGACLGVPVDVIEPCGFPLSDRAVRGASLDYAARAEVERHAGWESFLAARRSERRPDRAVHHPRAEPFGAFALRRATPCAAMALAEALRQTDGFPKPAAP